MQVNHGTHTLTHSVDMVRFFSDDKKGESIMSRSRIFYSAFVANHQSERNGRVGKMSWNKKKLMANLSGDVHFFFLLPRCAFNASVHVLSN